MNFDYQKSIDFLLENGRDVIQYRLHKDILHDLTEAEEEMLLEKVMQTPEYQLLLTHVKPNGYIGIGMHSWEKFTSMTEKTPQDSYIITASPRICLSCKTL